MTEEFDEIEIKLGGNQAHHEVSINSEDSKSGDDKKKSNKHINELIKGYGEKAMGYRYMHNQEYSYYIDRNDQYQKYSAILPILVTLLAGITASDILSSTGNKVFILLQLVISFIGALVTVFKDNGDFKVTGLNHRMAANNFSELYHMTEKYFALDSKTQQEKSHSVLENVTNSFDLLLSSDVAIRTEVMARYNEMAETKNITQVENIEKMPVQPNQTFRLSNKNSSKERLGMVRWNRNF